MYPEQLTVDEFVKLKINDFFIIENDKRIKEISTLFEGNQIYDAIDGLLDEIGKKVDERLTEWKSEFPPQLTYCVSTGTQYNVDDSNFLSLEAAKVEFLKHSESNPDNIYIIWELENYFLPHPIQIIFDGKVFSYEI